MDKQKNTQQPLDNGPWRHGITRDMKPRVFVESDDFAHDVRLYVDGDFSDTAERIAYAKGIAKQLNAAPPVPRDVLMLALECLFSEVLSKARSARDLKSFQEIEIAAIADSYASQVQPEPVNQQMLAALKSLYRGYVSTLETGRDRIVALGGQCDAVDVMERNDPALRDARSAIAAAEKELGHD